MPIDNFSRSKINQLKSSIGSSQIGFISSGTGAISRTTQDKMRDLVSVKDFGAVGDGVTDDTAAIQAAIDAAETMGAEVFVPAGIYKCTDTIFVGRTGTASLIGEGSAAAVADSNKGTKIDFSSLSDSKIAIKCGASSGRRHGVKLHDLFIFRSENRPTPDSGGIGVSLLGLVHFDFRNIVTFGFDKGCYMAAATGGGVCSGGIMEMCRFEKNGRSALHMNAAIECRFIRCKFGEAEYIIWLTSSELGDRPNGNQWVGGTAIASSISPCMNSLRIESGFFNIFEGISFEQATQQGIYIAIPASEVVQNRLTAIFNAIWTDAVGGVLCHNANIIISAGSRIRSTRSGYPTIQFNSDSSVSDVNLRSVISNSYIGWAEVGSLAIQINRYYNTVIEGNIVRDESGSGIAFVNFVSGTRCYVVNNNFLGDNRPGWSGDISGHVFRNRVGSGLTAAEYEANGTQKIAGDFIYEALVQYRDQRNGNSAETSGALFTRYGGGGAWLNLLAVQSSDGTYGNVPESADVGAVRAHAGDGTSAVEIATVLFQTDANSAAGNAAGRIRLRTKPASGSLTDRVTVFNNGVVRWHSLPVYADNTAAIAGGLGLGDMYRTSTGELRVRI